MAAAGCSVPNCVTAVKQSFHYIPSDSRRDQWLNFIYKDRMIPSSISSRLRVCSLHFTNDCFTNLQQVNMGFAKKKLLKPGAVPTIYPGDPERNSTSGVVPVSKSHCENVSVWRQLYRLSFRLVSVCLAPTRPLVAGFSLSSLKSTCEHRMKNVMVAAVTYRCMLFRRSEEINGFVEENF